MSPPVPNPGDVLTAAYVNAWLQPLAVVKPSAEHRITTTTLANDTALVLPVAASAIYEFRLFVHFQGGAIGVSDMKWDFTYPSGTNVTFHMLGYSAGNVDQLPAGRVQTDFPLTAGTNGAGNFRAMSVHGTVRTSSTAGNFQFRFAQNTSNATDTIVNTDSTLILERIG